MAYGPSGQTRTLVPLGRDDEPTVSPDGTEVVVTTHTGPISRRDARWAPWRLSGTGTHLTLISLVDGSRQPLTHQVKGRFDTSPTWNRAGDGWVYFLRSGRLMRLLPRTDEVRHVPHGDGISQFVLEPGGKTAWVEASWCRPGDGCGGAWRLDLGSGAVKPHTFDPAVSGDLAWSPDGARLAYAPNACGFPSCPALYVQRWPDGRLRPVLEAPSSDGVPRAWTVYGTVGWQSGHQRVVLQTTRLAWAHDPYGKVEVLGQRILLVDPADGSSVPIGGRSERDQDFDVWLGE
jgi:hypothetical protein